MNQMRDKHLIRDGYVNSKVAASLLGISAVTFDRITAKGYMDKAKQVIGNRFFYNPMMLEICYTEFLKFKYRRNKDV